MGQYNSATLKQPRAARDVTDVVSYNISYLYIAGLRTDEAVIPVPPPIWGDETNGPDVATDAWYGGGGGNTGNATAAQTRPGYYGPADNHGKEGGNFAFADGHGAFLTGNVHDTFYSSATNRSSSVNVIDPNRSNRIQTID